MREENRMTSQGIISALSTITEVYFRDEYAIQDEIERVLRQSSIRFSREHRLGPKSRVDFFVDGIAMEVKAGKPNSRRLEQQIERYAAFNEVSEVIIVVERNLFHMPELANGKPVHYVSLSANFGFAI
jgi:hypothetical protein